MATTLLELIVRVADLFGPLHEGTAEAGSTERDIVDRTNIEADDVWNNHYVYVREAGDAAPEGEERAVSDWVQSSGTLTVAPDFTAAITAGDGYLLLPAQRAALVRAINNAIEKATERWGIPTIDTTTITIAASTYQYSLPTDLVYLEDVLYRTSAQTPWQPIERGIWSVAGTVGAQVLDLQDIGAFAVGTTLRTDYIKRLSQLSTDASTLAIGAPAEPELIAFLIDYSLWYLHARAAGGVGGKFREHLTMAKDAREKAEEALEHAPRWQRSGRWHVPQRPSIRG